MTWQPIDTAPTDNKRLLYVAKFSEQGELTAIGLNAIWEFWQESWEMPDICGYYWANDGGVEDPTHWAYQDGAPPEAWTALLPEVMKDIDHICAHGDQGSQETAHDARDKLRVLIGATS